jgi:hypothetical protein
MYVYTHQKIYSFIFSDTTTRIHSNDTHKHTSTYTSNTRVTHQKIYSFIFSDTTTRIHSNDTHKHTSTYTSNTRMTENIFLVFIIIFISKNLSNISNISKTVCDKTKYRFLGQLREQHRCQTSGSI